MTRPCLACELVPEFEPDRLESVVAAFSKIPPMALGQSWLPEPEPGFLPAEVRAGLRKERLLVLATIPDSEIFTRVTEANQRTWELGDVFEIFLKPDSAPHYLELHVTPANIRTQLAFSAEGAEAEILPDGVFESRVWMKSDRWFVLASIPCAAITKRPGLGAGERWRFSFCRYDAFRNGRKPIISSTSPHPVPKFHRPSEWGVMVF